MFIIAATNWEYGQENKATTNAKMKMICVLLHPGFVFYVVVYGFELAFSHNDRKSSRNVIKRSHNVVKSSHNVHIAHVTTSLEFSHTVHIAHVTTSLRVLTSSTSPMLGGIADERSLWRFEDSQRRFEILNDASTL